MSDEVCPGCGAPMPIGARFCPGCGHRLTANEAEPAPERPQRLVPPAIHRPPASGAYARHSRGRQGTALWRHFVPALQLWMLFLLLNGVLGLAGHVVDISSPWFDVAATGVTGIAAIGCCRRDRAELAPLLRRSGLDERTWWQPIAVLAGLFAFLNVYFWTLGRLGLKDMTYLDDFRAHEWPPWSAFVLISVCPAVFEELAFRGFIQQRLGGVMGPREAIAVQAAMFSVLHMSPVVFPSHFVFGLLLGWLRRATGSLYPGMAIHGLWNAWVLLRETSNG